MKRFSIHILGNAYALTAYGDNKRDCINKFKRQNSLNRMPNGFSIWQS